MSKCKMGYTSGKDNICKFCREKLVSRSVAKRVGVKRSGDGMTLDQFDKLSNHEKSMIASIKCQTH